MLNLEKGAYSAGAWPVTLIQMLLLIARLCTLAAQRKPGDEHTEHAHIREPMPRQCRCGDSVES